MITKEFCKSKYIELREKLGQPPKLKEFLKFAETNQYSLKKLFGSNAYSKLQEACGDTSNKLVLKRTPLENILLQYGKLVDKLNKLPTQADWAYYNCRPSVSGIIRRPHNLRWPDLPNLFLNYAKDKPEWKRVVQIVDKENKLTGEEITSVCPPALFGKIINVIKKWHPQRKRYTEEAYKVDLRNFLHENTFFVSEEAGDSRADLLVNKKYPIELKKDPSLADYDRLLGQMVRHSEKCGSVIAVVCDVANQDQFEDFKRNMNLVFKGINRKAEIIPK